MALATGRDAAELIERTVAILVADLLQALRALLGRSFLGILALSARCSTRYGFPTSTRRAMNPF
jgi:hypothetical protein